MPGGVLDGPDDLLSVGRLGKKKTGAIGDHRAGLHQPGGVQRVERHHHTRPEGHEADRSVRLVGQRVTNLEHGLANPHHVAGRQAQALGKLGIDGDPARRDGLGKRAAAAKRGAADHRPGGIHRLQRHKPSLVTGVKHGTHCHRLRQPAMRAGSRKHSFGGRHVEASKLDISAKKKAGITGDSLAHRLGDRPDGADGRDAKHQRTEKHPEPGH